MVKTVVDDSEHTIIEVIHNVPEDEIKSVNLSEEDAFQVNIEGVKKELQEDYPTYDLVFATRYNNYVNHPVLGRVMYFTARGVKYY